MKRNDKIFAVLLICFIVIGCVALMLVKEQARKEAEEQNRAEQVASVKSDLENIEAEEVTREATNQQVKAERAEAERKAEEERQTKEAEEQAYQTWLASQSYTPSYNYPTSGLTKAGGVNYFNGVRETWYSSNQLYHYRTGEWTVDSEGFYRDSNGYYIVASNQYPNGTVIETSKGQSLVADKGCDGTDFYVKW